MSKENLADWYLERFKELPGIEFQVDKKSSTVLVISFEDDELPSVISLKLRLAKGYLTLESPLKIDKNTNFQKILFITNKLRSHLSVRDVNGSVVPVVRINLTVDDDFKLSKTGFHSSLFEFFSNHQTLLEHFERDQENLAEKSQNQNRAIKNKSATQQKAKVGFEI